MKKKKSKKQVLNYIEEFFKDINSKKPEQIKKTKKIAMAYNLSLGEKRKLFCKKCFNPYQLSRVRIRKNIKINECNNCKYISRWKIK